MAARGAHGRGKSLDATAIFVRNLVLHVFLLSSLQIYFDGENGAAAANVFGNETRGTPGSVSAFTVPTAPASTAAASQWRSPHEVVFTSREALQENNIPVGKNMLVLPANRVALPHEPLPSNTQESEELTFELPRLHPLVVLPARSPEQMLIDGRCREENLYMKVRPVGVEGVLELEVDSSFVPAGRTTELQLALGSVIVGDGVFDSGAEALLLCSEAGGLPVLISLSSLTTSSMPHFDSQPFSLLFKPRQIDIFQSASPNSAVLQIKGTAEADSSAITGKEDGILNGSLNYLAQVKKPGPMEVLHLLHNVSQSPRCHIERREWGGPVALACEGGDQAQGVRTLRRLIRPTGYSTAREKKRTQAYWKVAKALGATLLMFAAIYKGMSRVLYPQTPHVTALARKYSNGFVDAARRYGLENEFIPAVLDCARPSNMLTAAKHLLSRDMRPGQRVFSSGVLISGLGVYGTLGALAYLQSALTAAFSLRGRKGSRTAGMPQLRQPSQTGTATSSPALPEEFHKTVIYAVVP